MEQDAALVKLRTNIDEIAKFGVDAIGLFGSIARSETRDRSDVDILVRFRDGQKNFDNYMNLKYFLESLFEGKSVDLVIEESIKPRLKDTIMKEVVYAS